MALVGQRRCFHVGATGLKSTLHFRWTAFASGVGPKSKSPVAPFFKGGEACRICGCAVPRKCLWFPLPLEGFRFQRWSEKQIPRSPLFQRGRSKCSARYWSCGDGLHGGSAGVRKLSGRPMDDFSPPLQKGDQGGFALAPAVASREEQIPRSPLFQRGRSKCGARY